MSSLVFLIAFVVKDPYEVLHEKMKAFSDFVNRYRWPNSDLIMVLGIS
jgi:hypothetical protein